MCVGTVRRGDTVPGTSTVTVTSLGERRPALSARDTRTEASTMSETYWYCLHHQSVETEQTCPGSERMGPYATRPEAERALQSAAERTEAWDTDPRWNDD